MKVALVFVALIIFVGGLAIAGVFYAVHRASQKFHEVTAGITGTGASGAAKAATSSGGDPCRYLSKEDVGQAIGVEIVATQVDGEACSYLAKGNQGDMTAKHAAAMMGEKGVDAKSQKTIQDFAGGIFKMMPQEKQEQGSDASGNVPVLGISVSESASAIAEMKLNAKVLGNLGGSNMPSTKEDLDIGDQAFVTAGSIMMIRKGGKIVRIMFTTCPCGTENIKPLAEKVVAEL
ncbi:MAG: hypothetical protein ACYDA9_14360 [Terriglobia bacterium]